MENPDTWPVRVARFSELWEQWKAGAHLRDFTDLIVDATRELPACPGDPAVLLLDEAQDLSALEFRLARKWGNAPGVREFVVCGDPDQCQPAGTLITTSDHGDVPIERLDPDKHRLVSFDRHGSCLTGRRDGYAFEITSRTYRGELATITADHKRTRTTHDHRWAVKWAPASREKLVVYLMTRDGVPRVGWCKLHGSNGLHLKTRARLDNADSVWILRAFDDRRGASLYETEVAVRYGLPLPTFREKDSYQQLANAGLNSVLATRAITCLTDHHRDPRHPLWTRANPNVKQGSRTSMIVRTCNIDDDLFLVPVPHSRTACSWQPATITRQRVARRRVWSMNVEPHHTYIADGIVTMNNLYAWRGADPDAFWTGTAASERILERSRRVPRAVQAYALDWIRRIPGRRDVSYQPRLENPDDPTTAIVEGEVRALADRVTHAQPEPLLPEIQRDLDAGRTVMILASCGYMLEPIARLARDRGIPYHNPYRPKHGGWNPLRGAERLRAFLRPLPVDDGGENRMWTWDDVLVWIEPIKARGTLTHGAKALTEYYAEPEQFAADEMPPIDLGKLADMFSDKDALHHALALDLNWWERSLLESHARRYAYPCAVARKRGARALTESPRLILGTIHSVKGGVSDSVYIFPDISRAAALTGRHSPSQPTPASIRLFYVAMTRARERLTILEPAGQDYVALPRPDGQGAVHRRGGKRLGLLTKQTLNQTGDHA